MMPPRIAPQLRCSRNSANIRIPLIYFVNRFFLMFGRVGNIKAFSCMHDLALLSSTYDAPKNCSAASLLPQFCKHSNSADLLRKSLLSHVWAGRKYKSFFVQARTAFLFPTLGHHISPSSNILSNVSLMVFTACSVVQSVSWAPAMLIWPPPPSFSITSCTFTSSIDLALIYSLSS